MVIRKPYTSQLYCASRSLAWYVTPLASLGLLATAFYWQHDGAVASLFRLYSGNAPLASNAVNYSADAAAFGLPLKNKSNYFLTAALSHQDQELYSSIFQAQKMSDWSKADDGIALLTNDSLVGHVLALRYQDKNYASSAEELVEWLTLYGDHPQTGSIRALALAKFPALRSSLPTERKQSRLGGYGDSSIGTALESGTGFRNAWNAALTSWKNGNKADAAKRFNALSNQADGSWNRAASAYWAARAYGAIGNKGEESRFLRLAAQEPRSFYGILACKQLNLPLALDSNPTELTDSDVLELYSDPAIRRILCLVQLAMPEMAEQEMRALFPQYDDNDKLRLLALAHQLNMASVQISMAKQLESSEHPLDFAVYPVPRWQPQNGFTVDPALIYALARQESGFRAGAVSAGGALGLMQLMPQTALLVQKHMKGGSPIMQPAAIVSEPVMNLTLGQHYIERLLDNESVDGNLIFLLAAYNAGPGKLQEWKQSMSRVHDPLLFVESLPYSQTRTYIMKVMTNYWIYKELEGKSSHSIMALLKGKWPSYDEPERLTFASRDHTDDGQAIP